MNSNYQKVEWINIPEDLCNKIIAYTDNAYNLATFLKSDDRGNYHQYDAPEELKDWCKKNLPIDDSYTIRIQKMFNMDRVENHVDIVRDSVYNYLLSSTGPETRWYNSDGNVIESVIFEQHNWYKLITNVIHSVENISTPRISVSVFQKNKVHRIPDWAKAENAKK